MNVRKIGSTMGACLAFIAVLSMVASPGFVGFAAAEEGCPPCAYLATRGCDPIGGNKYHCYSSVGINCNVKWAALNVEFWVNGVHIPPIDVPSPFDTIVQTNNGDIYFYTWVTHQCNPGCCNCG